MKMPSVMSHDFSKVPQADIPRSSFKRDHGYKTTFDAGLLVPIFVDEALPGDTFNLSMTGFGRLSTPLFPIMDNMFLETFFFAVPNRLLWQNWEKFNGQQDNPGDSTDYLIPTVPSPDGGFTNSSIADYMGIPTGVRLDGVNALYFRAYNLIWNEWFRDENLQDSIPVNKDDGPDDPGDYIMRRRGKRHDYFTSCLPWPQKGDAVSLPLGTTAPIVSDAKLGMPLGLESTITGGIQALRADQTFVELSESKVSETLYTNLSGATAATINQLREAFQVQKLLERDARGGTRYTEIVRSHFGVTSPDARMQRPEYLGGGSSRVNINPIAQTSSTDDTSPQGSLAAVGSVTASDHGFTKSFTEHCVVIGLAMVRADLNYQQGLNRIWSRQGRFDYYWPSLAHIGEQAVLNKEIYAQGNDADDDVFGYQERYAEYRYKPSLVTGQFRSNYSQSLDAWHLAQDFDSLPVLNSKFIEERPPVDRIKAIQKSPDFILDTYFRYTCARPMPTYGVPGLIDHF